MTKRSAVEIQFSGLRMLTVVMAAGLLSGCASIVSGPRQSVGVSSTPSGAIVKIDDIDRGRTPLNVELERKKAPAIRIELDGYTPYEVVLDHKLNPWVWGNVVFPPGVIVDLLAGNGAALNLVPQEVHAQLVQGTPSGQATASPAASLPSFLNAPPVGKTLVCFYRKRNFVGAAGGWEMSDGGKPLVNLRNGTYFYYFAEPGEHRYHSGLTVNKETKVINVSAGDVIFIRAELGFGPLTVMPAPQAIQEIGKGRLRRRQ